MMLAVMACSSLAPIAAQADGFRAPGAQLQAQKNDWRNAALVSAAVGIYGLASHQKTAAELGIVGAIISTSQYERDSRMQNDRDNCRVENCNPAPVVYAPVNVDCSRPGFDHGQRFNDRGRNDHRYDQRFNERSNGYDYHGGDRF
jgi:hypothetical protein